MVFFCVKLALVMLECCVRFPGRHYAVAKVFRMLQHIAMWFLGSCYVVLGVAMQLLRCSECFLARCHGVSREFLWCSGWFPGRC